MDFATFTLPWGRRHALVIVLGYSRLLWLRFYPRQSFFYGRSFASDDDLNEQTAGWLEGTANVRRHATTGERSLDRFERDERAALLPLANCPYRRLGASQAPEPSPRPVPAAVTVERRPLSVYAEALQWRPRRRDGATGCARCWRI